MRTNQKVTTVDFSDDKQFQAYMDIYEGIDLPKEAPLFMEIIQQTRKRHIKDNGCSYKTLLQMDPVDDVNTESPWVDGIIVDYVNRNIKDGTIEGQITVSLTEVQSSIAIAVALRYDDKENKTTSEIVYNVCHEKFKFSLDDIDPTTPLEHVVVLATVSQIDENLNLTAQALTAEVSSLELNSNTPIRKIAVVDPENICTDLGTPVQIAYGRGVYSGETLDYEYDAASNITFPFNGYVFFKDGNEFDTSTGVSLILDCGKGTTQYRQSFSNVFKKTEEGFKWNFSEDWGQPINYSTIPANCLINLTLQLVYSFHSITDDKWSQDTLFISGDNNPKYHKITSYQQIPKLIFLWGCLGKDSKVHMFDKTTKAISDIVAGDIVLSTNGDRLTVKQVLKGYEKNIIRILTDNSCEILATETHPILTTNGIRKAGELNSKDKVICNNGEYSSVISRYITTYDDDVYNLTFEQKHKDQYFYCNNIAVGDNDLQNKIGATLSVNKNIIPIDLKNELISLNSIINNK